MGTSARPKVLTQAVDLNGPVMADWNSKADRCALEDLYENPGPIQFRGACTKLVTKHLQNKSGPSYMDDLASLQELAEFIQSELRPGCSRKSLRIANSSLTNLRNILGE